MTCVCVWLAVGWEVLGVSGWVTGLGLGFTNFGGTLGKCDMCLCFGCGGVGGVGGEWVGGVGGEWVGGLGQGLGGWGCVLSVCVVSLDSLCRCQVQVSVYCARRIPAPSVQSCCTLSISAS